MKKLTLMLVVVLLSGCATTGEFDPQRFSSMMRELAIAVDSSRR